MKAGIKSQKNLVKAGGGPESMFNYNPSFPTAAETLFNRQVASSQDVSSIQKQIDSLQVLLNKLPKEAREAGEQAEAITGRLRLALTNLLPRVTA